MASNKGLGKGLGALLGDFAEEPVEQSAYRELPIYKVEPNPEQPRREFDEEEVEVIYGESYSGDGFGQAVMNRLMKAAGYCIINKTKK